MMLVAIRAALLLFLGLAGSATVAAEMCGKSFLVTQRTFQQLSVSDPSERALEMAFVWVDDIASGFFGQYKPFELYVVVGRAYKPFGSTSGKLKRQAFLNLSDKQSVNNDRFRLTVPASLKGTARLKFFVNRRPFELEVVRVRPVTIGDDSVEFRVCRP
jgi:hypothetical protein